MEGTKPGVLGQTFALLYQRHPAPATWTYGLPLQRLSLWAVLAFIDGRRIALGFELRASGLLGRHCTT
jgi:hypothetical protein